MQCGWPAKTEGNQSEGCQPSYLFICSKSIESTARSWACLSEERASLFSDMTLKTLEGGEKKDLTYSKRRGKQRFHKATLEIGIDFLTVLIQLRGVLIGTYLNY